MCFGGNIWKYIEHAKQLANDHQQIYSDTNINGNWSKLELKSYLIKTYRGYGSGHFSAFKAKFNEYPRLEFSTSDIDKLESFFHELCILKPFYIEKYGEYICVNMLFFLEMCFPEKHILDYYFGGSKQKRENGETKINRLRELRMTHSNIKGYD